MIDDTPTPPLNTEVTILSEGAAEPKDPEAASAAETAFTLLPRNSPSEPVASAAPDPRDAQPGHVYLTGAGPGNPDLLTLRAAHLLRTATLILADGLISPEILALANPAAEILSVAKRCGDKPRITQAEIHTLMIDAARDAQSVVRLKSGDPLVFGRAGEEIAALRSASIPFEIVPGITAAFAAAASLQTPLTDRRAASRLILATAHHAANKPAFDPDPQPIWHGALPTDATLVLYMPGPDLEALARTLVHSGIDPATPVAAISRASTPAEQSHSSTLEHLRSHNVGPAPVLLLIGQAIRNR